MKDNKIFSMFLVLAILNGCSNTNTKIETKPTPTSTPEITPTALTTIYFDDIDLEHLEDVFPNSLYYACEFDEGVVYKIYSINKNFDSETNELVPYRAGNLYQFNEEMYTNTYENNLIINKPESFPTDSGPSTYATQVMYYYDVLSFIGGADMEFLTEENLYGLMLPKGFETTFDSGLYSVIEEIERNIISGDYEEEPYIYKCNKIK